jgi:hypothetical protein
MWGLLSLWLFFGCLELGEQLNVIVETAEEDHAGQDPDQEALSQLAAGLKSQVEHPRAPSSVSVLVEHVPPIVNFSVIPIHGTRPAHGPPSLRLHQQLSVYRI